MIILYQIQNNAFPWYGNPIGNPTLHNGNPIGNPIDRITDRILF